MTDMLSIQDMNSVLNEVGLSGAILDLIKSKLHEKATQLENEKQQTTEYVYLQLAKEYDDNSKTCGSQTVKHHEVIRDYFANKASGGTETFYITQQQKNDIISELQENIVVAPEHVGNDLHKEVCRLNSVPVYWKV